MNMNSRWWRFMFWLMGWAPLLTLLIQADSWGAAKSLAVGFGVAASLFAVSLLVASARLVATGRDPDFGTADGPSKLHASAFKEPPSHVRHVDR